MNILVIGSGGREHTLAWKLSQSSKADKIYALPGNPGMADVAMCVEGEQMPSEAMARLLAERENSGRPKLCFVIGGSNGLDESVKDRADLRLSMSKMTFPHHLARVMLAEQVYRGYKIREGSKYHK